MLSFRNLRDAGILSGLVLAVSFAVLDSTAQADTFTWTNASTGWNTAAAWANISGGAGTVPGSLDVAQFTLPSYSGTPTLSAAASLGGIWDTGAGTFTINSNALTLYGATINGNANTGIELDASSGSMTIASAITLGAAQTWLNNSTKPLKVSGNITTGGFALTYGGNGNTTFSGALGTVVNDGASLIVNGGTLTLASQSSDFNGGTIVNNGARLVVASSGGNFGAVGRGNVTVYSGGTISMGGAGLGNHLENEFMGQNPSNSVSVHLNAGGLIVDPIGSQNAIPALYMDGGTLQSTVGFSQGNWLLSGSITTPGDGSTSYISGGTVSLNQSSSPGNVFNITGSNDSVIISSAVTGSRAFVKTGNGLLVLTASNNNYNSATTISAGTLQLGNGLPNQDGNLTGTQAITDNGVLVFDMAGNNTTYRGLITGGTGSFVKTGPGTLWFPGFLGASNVGVGTVINQGALELTRSTVLFGTVPMTINGGTLNLNGVNSTVAGLNGSGGVVYSGPVGSVLTLAPTTATNYYGSVVGSTGVTINSTTAVQTFSGVNTTTGTISVAAGTLALAANGTLGQGPNIINPGAALDTSAFSGGYNHSQGVLVAGRTDGSFATDINGSINLLPGGTLSPAGSNVAGAMTISSGLTLGGGTISFDQITDPVSGNISNDLFNVMGTLTIVPSSTTWIVPTGPLTNGTYTLAIAPSIMYSGSDDLENHILWGGPFTQTGRPQNFNYDTSAGSLNVIISGGAGTLVWTASQSNVWDASTPNWFLTNLSGGTDHFYTGDLVTFDDTAGSAAGNVVISGTVSPATVTVNNNSVNYTFSGGPIAGGAPLLKTGTGSLTLNSPNLYSSGTTLAAGLLNIGDPGALGTGRFTITGGSLDNTTGAPMTLGNSITKTLSGNFTFVGSNPMDLGSGTVTVGAPSTMYVSSSTMTISAPIVGPGRLGKDGPGTLMLTASNGYGSTILYDGVLNFVNHSLGTGGVVLDGGTLQYASGNTYDVSGNGLTLGGIATVDTNGNNVTWQQFNGIFGTGSLIKIGLGNLTLNATESYTGSTTVNGGALTLSGYQYGSGNNYSTVWGTLPGVLNINSGGLVNLSNQYVLGVNTNQHTTAININGGTLSPNSAIGWGTNVSMTAGAINGGFILGSGATINVTGTDTSSLINGSLFVGDSADLTFNVTRGAAAADLIIAGGIGYADPFSALDADPIGGSSPNFTYRSSPSLGWETGGVVFKGNGIVVLGGSSSYFGNTTINGGTLQLGTGGVAATLPVSEQLALGTFGPTTLGPSGPSAIIDNGTLAFNCADSLVQGVHFSALPITGSGSIAQLGPGNLTLNAANAYTGGTTLSGGLLTVANVSALGGGAAGPLTVNAGVLDLNGYNVFANGFSGIGGTITSAAPATLSVAPTANSNYAGTITGAVSFTVNAPGATMTLAGPNTYTGLTTVTAGTLAGSLGSGGLVVAPGAVADVSIYGNGGFPVAGSVLVAGRPSAFATDIVGSVNAQNSLVSPAGSGIAGTMTISGNLGLSGGTLAYDLGDQIAAGGALTLGGANYLVPGSPIASGVYTLITAGSVPADVSSFTMGGLFSISPRQQFVFASSGGTAVTLTVFGNVGNLVWTGGSNNTWDNALSTSWFNTTSGSADVFNPGDLATFDDTAGSANHVSINDAVQPAIVTVNNGAVKFTFGGSGSIVGGGSLTKTGSGALTITNSNSYSGGTTLNQGTLNANAVQAIGIGPLVINGGIFNGNAAQAPTSVAISGGLVNVADPSAFGTAALTISGGSLDNTAGTAMTLAGNNPQTWNGSFTFIGSNPLNIGAGSVSLTQDVQVTVANSNLTVGGIISGTASLTLNGPGTLTLAASNAYGGGTAINSGVLDFATGGLSSGPITLNGGVLQFAVGNTQDVSANGIMILSGATAAIDTQSNTVTFANGISGGGGLRKLGAGTLVLNSSNTFTGGTTVNAGTLSLGYNNGGVGTLQGTLTINPGATVVTAVNNALGYNGANWVQNITINGGVLSTAVASDNGWGTTINMTAGTMSTTVSGGYFSMGNTPVFNITGTNASSLISANLTDRDAANGIVFNVARGTAPADLIINGGIFNAANGGGITLNGNGVTVLGGANSYNGPTLVSGGVLQVGSSAAFGNSAVTLSGGTLDLAGNNVTLPGFSGVGGVVNSASNTTATLTVSQGFFPTYYSGSIADGAGRTALAIRSGTLVLSGSSNTYSGGTSVFTNGATVAPPVLQMGVPNALPYGAGAGNVLVSSSGTLDLVGNLTNINGLSGNGTVDSSLFSGTLVVGHNNATSTFSGVLTNSSSFYGAYLSLTKVGSGTLTLSGTGSYLGGTTVDGGSLVVTNSQAMADGTSLTIGDPSLLSDFPAAVVPSPAVSAAAAAAPVPEPGTLTLALGMFSAAAACSRLWRRRPTT